jgi:hypothetical protein
MAGSLKKALLAICLLVFVSAAYADNDHGCLIYLCLSNKKGETEAEGCATPINVLKQVLKYAPALPTCRGHDGITIMDDTKGYKPEEAFIYLSRWCCDSYCTSWGHRLFAPVPGNVVSEKDC